MANIFISTQHIQLFLGARESGSIEVTNVSPASVVYKLLTTSPERYAVKQKKGIILPNSSKHVTIALKESLLPPGNSGREEEVIKDTFLLEYALVEKGDNTDPNHLSELLKEKKRQSLSSKKMISCRVFLGNNRKDNEGEKKSGVPKTHRKAPSNNNTSYDSTKVTVSNFLLSAMKWGSVVVLSILIIYFLQWRES